MATVFNSLEVENLVRGDGIKSRVYVNLASVANSNWTTSASLAFASGELTISGLTSGTSLGLLDSVEPNTGDRILIKDASTASAGTAANAGYNGIWNIISGTATSLVCRRAGDLEDGDSAALIHVWTLAGTINSETGWVCVTATSIASNGTNPTVWKQFDTVKNLDVSRGGTGVTSFGGNNTLLYTTSQDTLSSITAANSSVLTTNASGVPSLATTLPESLTIPAVSSFSLNDTTNTNFDLAILSAGNLTADKTLTFDVNDVNTVISTVGNLTFGGAFTTDNSITFNTTAPTVLTLPESGTLANQAYVDSVAQGLDVKDSVRIATTQNSNWTTSASLAFSSPTLTISGLTSGTSLGLIDSLEPAVNDRILIKDAAAASAGTAASNIYNGIWSVTGGTTTSLTLTRSIDADEDAEVTPGLFTFVEEGTVANAGFVVTTTGTITVNTTEIVFGQFSGAGAITAGAGLIKSGGELSADLKTNGGIVFETNQLSVDLSATSITGTLAVSDGGTGKTSVTANSLLYGAGTAALSEITPAADSVLVTSATSVPSLSRTLPSGLTIPSPIIDFIADSNSNEVLIFSSVASAVNELTIENAATGTSPTLLASGGDVNIDLRFSAKGTGNYVFESKSGTAAQIKLFEDSSLGTNFLSFKPGDLTADTVYTWPDAPVANNYILTAATTGDLTWSNPNSINTVRDFDILSNKATTTGNSPSTLVYFPWDNSELSSYSTRTITFWHVTGTNPLIVEIFDGTSVLGTVTTTASTSGIASFTFTAPGVDSLLQLRIGQSSSGAPRPEISGVFLTLS